MDTWESSLDFMRQVRSSKDLPYLNLPLWTAHESNVGSSQNSMTYPAVGAELDGALEGCGDGAPVLGMYVGALVVGAYVGDVVGTGSSRKSATAEPFRSR